MRSVTRVGAIGAVVIALMLSGCGSTTPPTTPGELFREYASSTDVKNDRVLNFGSGDDRLANFAAHYTADQLQTALLSAYPCARPGERVGLDPLMPVTGSRQCVADEAVVKAAEDFAGRSANVYGRSVVVRHRDGSLELMWLYVVHKPDNTAALIDAAGETYGPTLTTSASTTTCSTRAISSSRRATSHPCRAKARSSSSPGAPHRPGSCGSSADSVRPSCSPPGSASLVA